MNTALIAVTVAAYILSVFLVNRAVIRIGKKRNMRSYRVKYVTKTLTLTLTLLFLAILTIVAGVDYSRLSLFISSVFAVIGVALFAQWSILSNITASLVIFFTFPYRVGDKVRVIETEHDIYGTVEEITLFHVLIRHGDDVVTYPNTLMLQRAVVKFSPETDPRKETYKALKPETSKLPKKTRRRKTTGETPRGLETTANPDKESSNKP